MTTERRKESQNRTGRTAEGDAMKSLAYSAVNDPQLVTAGYVDFTNIPQAVSTSKREDLLQLDERLRAQQTRMARLKLYREIMARGDIGEGWALGFTDALQAQEWNCEEIAANNRTIRSMERAAKIGHRVTTGREKANAARTSASRAFVAKIKEIMAGMKKPTVYGACTQWLRRSGNNKPTRAEIEKVRNRYRSAAK